MDIIKQNQLEMKNRLTEMNNLQGINSRVDETKNQISDLKYKTAKNIQLEQQKEKNPSKMSKGLLRRLQAHQHSHHRGARRKERARN